MSTSHEDLEIENECLRLQLAQAEEELEHLHVSRPGRLQGDHQAPQRDLQKYVLMYSAPRLLESVANTRADRKGLSVLHDLSKSKTEAASAEVLPFESAAGDGAGRYSAAEWAGVQQELERRWETIDRLNAENLDLSRRQTLLDIEISNLEAQLDMVKTLFLEEQ